MGKRILIICPTPTHPPTSGSRVRISTIIANLKRMGHEVHLLHIERERGDRQKMREVWGDTYHATTYKPHRDLVHRAIRRFGALLNSEWRYRYSADEWWDKGANAVITRLQQRFTFEVVMVEYVFFSKALTLFEPGVLKILDTHDVFSDRHRVYLRNGMQPQWYSTSQRHEARALNRADLVIAIQDVEREFFLKLTRKPVVTVGHVVRLEHSTPRQPAAKILYLGSRNPINADAMEWFITGVLPKIRQALPQAELFVAGTVCELLPNSDDLIKLGIVDDLSAAYDQADVVVNPILNGTGLKIKNIEALGYSKALVTTPVGADGLEDGAGHAFLVATSPEEFATQVIQACTDRELNMNLACHGYEYAKKWNERHLKKLEASLTLSPGAVSCDKYHCGVSG